ncbi:UNVERIFIED_CONTAM: hypothetical protein FKN15_031918 [Acipenser sinensis]
MAYVPTEEERRVFRECNQESFWYRSPGLQIEDETPKKAPIMYEELRNKNRENYEVTMTQKAEVLLKPQQDRAPKTEGNVVNCIRY